MLGIILKIKLKNLNKKIRKYSIKGSVLLLSLFVLLFAFTIIIILYLINKRYVIYAKAERTNYLKGVYPQKKEQILSYLIKKTIKDFYSTSLIYNQEGLYNIYNTLTTFYSTIGLNGTINHLYMLYNLYSTNSSYIKKYWLDFNLYGYNTITTIYATAKTVDLTNYLVYNNNHNFKFKELFSKNTLTPLEKKLIKKIIDTNKEQIKTVFQDLGTVTFEGDSSYNIYQIDETGSTLDSSNLSITKNIKYIVIKFKVNNRPYKMIIRNTEIKTSVANIIEMQIQTNSSNTIVYPYMNSYIKSTIIKSSNAEIVKL